MSSAAQGVLIRHTICLSVNCNIFSGFCIRTNTKQKLQLIVSIDYHRVVGYLFTSWNRYIKSCVYHGYNHGSNNGMLSGGSRHHHSCCYATECSNQERIVLGGRRHAAAAWYLLRSGFPSASISRDDHAKPRQTGVAERTVRQGVLPTGPVRAQQKFLPHSETSRYHARLRCRHVLQRYG